MGTYHRETWAEINLDHIYENVANMRKHLPSAVKIFAVVKANGYGHGDMETANTALEAGADYLAVAFLDEALALRKKGIQAPILVLGASRPENARIAAEQDIALTVFQKEWLESAIKEISPHAPLKIHVKCDSGMGRLGIRTKEELEHLEDMLLNENKFLFEGIYTHFATADELNTEYYKKQLAAFKAMLSWLKVRPALIHAANSAASLRFHDHDFNAVRMGISMYGLSPSMEMKEILPFPLKQAMSLKTRIVQLKQLSKGDSVSYGATYKAERPEWIATLPIGYADGWIRKLQGQEVLVNGERLPIIGRICMDQCMVKLKEEQPLGTEVTLIGESAGSFISIDEIAEKLETINYEVVCLISARVPRVYHRLDRVVKVVNPLLQ
ncbi:alanine racemase [Bacillus sp. V59.32b]|uniref:alanine racemase n=1 Tax=Bacillus sp. V59.32b TaxID=1758642 RepID=UPI000E3CE63A|nr:alanine racemase [Bacillus sp. V59.32b]RFU67894.1 alanine racemase [Bacillus sp. V59.32b]